MLPTAAVEHQRQQKAEADRALLAIAQLWRSLRGAGRDLGAVDTRWRSVRAQILAQLVLAQRAMVGSADGYVSSVLRETGQAGVDASLGSPVVAPLVGVAGDGRPLVSLLDGAPIRMKDEIVAGASAAAAFKSGFGWLGMASQTALSDAGRQAEVLAVAVRPEVTGYVRMLTPPSCSRCAILAGRRFRTNTGFDRHPRCDCRHIPASEDVAGDLRSDPKAYFRSLPTADEAAEQYPDLTVKQRRKRGIYTQEDVFTRDGAKAIRAGADPSRVVNARRGMSTAQVNTRGWAPRGRLAGQKVFGREVFTTTEATTKLAGWRGGVRLMPETIVSVAKDQDDLVRLLRLHGYIV